MFLSTFAILVHFCQHANVLTSPSCGIFHRTLVTNHLMYQIESERFWLSSVEEQCVFACVNAFSLLFLFLFCSPFKYIPPVVFRSRHRGNNAAMCPDFHSTHLFYVVLSAAIKHRSTFIVHAEIDCNGNSEKRIERRSAKAIRSL